MIPIVAPTDRDVVRCTLGYAWQLAMEVHRNGWGWWAEMSLAQLVGRIGLWHQGGIGRWWS